MRDPATLDRSGHAGAANDSRDAGAGRSPVHGIGLRKRETTVHDRTSIGDHSLFPHGVSPYDASCSFTNRDLAVRNGLAVASGRWTSDPVGADLGDQGAQVTARSKSNILELCAGCFCSDLGLDLV